MGCFLSCFRGEPDPSGNLRDPLVRESRLGDAFLDDEKQFEATARLDAPEAANGEGVDEELRREANYLKSCGAISQTPPEILEVQMPFNSEDADEGNYLKSCGAISQTRPEILEVPMPFNSEDANEGNDTSINVQLTKDETLVGNDTSINVQLTKDATPIEENLSEVINSDKNDTLSHEQCTDENTLRVEPETQPSLQDKPLCQNVRDQSTGSSDSPYPTPLVIRGDIQTPGTVFASYKESSKPGKRARANRQFIYPVLRPIENKLQWMEVKAAESPVLSSNPPKRRNLSEDPSETAQQTPASSTLTKTESSESESFPFHDNSAAQDEVASPEEPKCLGVGELPKQSSEHGKLGVSSLSHWLKPSSAGDWSDVAAPDGGSVGREPCSENETSLFDAPVFPAFGLAWESDNPTPVLPKAWDGNGIPNTTTKYKEDQRVSWHATPFEERLLKVLSDEKPRHERKISGMLIHLEENAES